MKKIVTLVWFPYGERSRKISEALGGSIFYIYYNRHEGEGYIARFFHYVEQFIRSIKVLAHEKPSVIIAQAPPVFCPLTVFLWSFLNRVPFIVDAFTGSFFRNWKWSLFLQKILSKKALVTFVPEKISERIVNGWGARAMVIEDGIIDLDVHEKHLSKRPKIGVVGIFADDEPMKEIFQAAQKLDYCDFYITGKTRKEHIQLIAAKSENINVTGFLGKVDYEKFLKEMEILVVLTNVKYAMNCGAFEGVSANTPIVLSNHELIRNYFHKGAVFVENTSEGIAEGICTIIKNYGKFKEEIKLLHCEKKKEWLEKILAVKNMLEQ